LELGSVKRLLEALARREEHAHVGDTAGGHLIGLDRALAGNADAEREAVSKGWNGATMFFKEMSPRRRLRDVRCYSASYLPSAKTF
jgi:hypothetical protein